MAFYTGTAASLSALRDALLTHAQADGWVLTGEVLSKSGAFVRIQLGANDITALGCESNAVANPAPEVVRIGVMIQDYASGVPLHLISYPATYMFFGFEKEAYFVVNYDTTFYQWMAFGMSTVPVPGAGGWVAASRALAAIRGSAPARPINMGPNGLGSSVFYDYSPGPAALFWSSHLSSSSIFRGGQRNCWVNHNLDGLGWMNGAVITSPPIGIPYLNTLLTQQPSAWNSEAALLPIQHYLMRGSNRISITADLEHARHIRIDNIAPGSILTLGTDKWMVFPWFVKNAALRDAGDGVDHTGTFGWAIRYEGP